MRLCFDDDDRELINIFGFNEDTVCAEAWHRAAAQTYYENWKAYVRGSPFKEERLAFIFLTNYAELSNKLRC